MGLNPMIGEAAGPTQITRDNQHQTSPKGDSMNELTFDQVMAEIAMGLERDAEHDIPYLKSKAEEYRDHPQSREILRTIGRMIFDALPDDKKDEFQKLVDNHADGTESVLKEVVFCLKTGDPEKALHLIEPLVQSFDEMITAGCYRDDKESVYFDFTSPIEEIIWRVHTDESRIVRVCPEPFSHVYALYSACLYETGQHEAALAAEEKAIRWNPSDVNLRFEVGENYKKLGDMEALNEALDTAHPYVRDAAGMAKFHREKAFYLVETGNYELAAAYLVFSTVFENSNLVGSELMYLKRECGADFTGMTVDEATAVLEKSGETYLPDEGSLAALSSIIGIALKHDDAQTATRAAIDLYELTGDEDVRQLAMQLMGDGEGEQ